MSLPYRTCIVKVSSHRDYDKRCKYNYRYRIENLEILECRGAAPIKAMEYGYVRRGHKNLENPKRREAAPIEAMGVR
jgi:hypothetical protein